METDDYRIAPLIDAEALAPHREVMRQVNAEIEVAADQLMLAGWTFEQLLLVRYAEDTDLIELAVVPRPGVNKPVFQVRTGRPTEENGWTIAVTGTWLRAIPKPRTFVGTFKGVKVYEDETLEPNEMIMEPAPAE